MAELALVDAFAHVHGHDFTTDTNQLGLDMEAAALDKTTYGSGGWRENAFGLKTVAFGMQGFWQAGADQVDPDSFDDLGVTSRVHTFGPIQTEGQVAYLWRAGFSQYQLFGQVGELAPFTLQSAGTDGAGAVRGMLAKKKGAVSAAGATGAGVNLGAVSATQFLYASLHVFTAGTTISVQVESDSDNTFATPTARGTIGPVTARGGSWMTRVAGPITDTWFRFNVTAVTGSFSVAGAIAIGN